MEKKYDVVIIGAGAAGLTAGIYSSRSGLKTLILERTCAGGQILKTDVLENYPGFAKGISGFDLIGRIKAQAQKFGAEIVNDEVVNIETRNQSTETGTDFYINTNTGEEYGARAIIVATGANPKKIGIKGEVELTGKGVSYCATCDGPLFKNKEVIVVGGGDAAAGEAIYLTKFADKVILLHRRDKLRAAKILQDRLLAHKKVAVRWNSIPVEILGQGKVRGIKIKDVRTNIESEIPASGVFIYVGLEPNTGFLKGKLELDEKGFIITEEAMRASAEGIFACGDVRKNTLKQVVTACAEGAVAAYSCWHYLEE